VDREKERRGNANECACGRKKETERAGSSLENLLAGERVQGAVLGRGMVG